MKRFRKEKTMKRKIMAIGAVLAWVCGVCGATYEGVQLWENGPLWAKANGTTVSGVLTTVKDF